MAEGEEYAIGDLGWKLLSAPNEDGKRKQAAFGYGNSEEFKVPSGEYLLTLKRGSASAEKEIIVSAGATTEVTLNLNAGTWTGEAYMSETSEEAVTSDVGWQVFSLPNEEGQRKKVAFSYGKAKYYLPAGDYIAELKRGAASVEKEISVRPGEDSKDRLVLNAAAVAFKGSEGRESPLIFVHRSDDETKKKIAFQYRNETRFYLPAGDFVAVYTYKSGGETKKTETPFTVEAGKFQEVNLP